jgi:hypothetical protein
MAIKEHLYPVYPTQGSFVPCGLRRRRTISITPAQAKRSPGYREVSRDMNCVVVQLATELSWRGWLAVPRAALRLHRGYRYYTPYGVVCKVQNHPTRSIALAINYLVVHNYTRHDMVLYIARQGIHINRKDRQDNNLLPVGHSFLINESPLGNCK